MHQQPNPLNQLASAMVAVTLVLIAGGVYLLIRGSLFVCTTFAHHPKRKALWIALAICLVLVGVGTFLAIHVSQWWQYLAYAGVGVLLQVCAVVDLQERTLFLREHVNVVDEILHTSWWGSENKTPTP